MKFYVPVDPDLVSTENEKSETPSSLRNSHENLRVAFMKILEKSLQALMTYVATETDKNVLLMKRGSGLLWDWKMNYERKTALLFLFKDLWKMDSERLFLRNSAAFSSINDNYVTKIISLFIRKPLRLCLNPSLLQYKEGRTPLYFAAVKGRLNFLEEMMSLELVDMIMKHGETVLHLAAKNNKSDVVRYLMEYFHIIKLGSSTDNDGNTILHLATTAKLNKIISYLVTRKGTDVNALNRHRLTPLGVVESDIRNFVCFQLSSPLENAGHKNSSQSLPQSADIQNTTITTDMSRKSVDNTLIMEMSPSNLLLSILHNHCQARHLDLRTEEDLQNTRNRMTIAAVLIATLSFVAGINPPCAVHQEGMTSRNILLGRTTAYMVFLLCNNVAFFSSLGVTGALFSTIPFSRTPMIKLLAVTHKIMWVSLSFTVAAYIAAAFMM